MITVSHVRSEVLLSIAVIREDDYQIQPFQANHPMMLDQPNFYANERAAKQGGHWELLNKLSFKVQQIDKKNREVSLKRAFFVIYRGLIPKLIIGSGVIVLETDG